MPIPQGMQRPVSIHHSRLSVPIPDPDRQSTYGMQNLQLLGSVDSQSGLAYPRSVGMMMLCLRDDGFHTTRDCLDSDDDPVIWDGDTECGRQRYDLACRARLEVIDNHFTKLEATQRTSKRNK